MHSPAEPRPRERLRRLTRTLGRTITVGTAGSLLLAGGPVSLDRAEEQRVARPTLATTLVTTLVTGSGTGAGAGLRLVSARTRPWPGHPGRRLVGYRVRRGDTATGLAVRFHAWTDELRAINHLGSRSTLYVGERITIPVVLAAVRRERAHRRAAHHRAAHHRAAHHRAAHHKATHHKATHHKATHHKATHHKATHHKATHHKATHRRPTPGPRWRYAGASRVTVRRVVVRTARRHGVDPHLALAVAWQESGWQQRRVSSSGAVGVMQVMPATGRWMSLYLGRRLNLHGLFGNVTAGIVLLSVLGHQTHGRRVIGAYYQGLGSVQAHGIRGSTRSYVRNVVALRRRLAGGWNPG